MKFVIAFTGWLARINALEAQFRACHTNKGANREADSESDMKIGRLREAFFKASSEDEPQTFLSLLCIRVQMYYGKDKIAFIASHIVSQTKENLSVFFVGSNQ